MNNEINIYASAVESIKTAILQGQYEALKGVNRIQLATYYGIGRYLSQYTRKGVWGTGALKSISEQLQMEQIGERESLDVDERIVEKQIVQNIESFIMTLGRDFAFIGNHSRTRNNSKSCCVNNELIGLFLR